MMEWNKPRLEQEIKMDAEIGSYQEDDDAGPDVQRRTLRTVSRRPGPRSRPCEASSEP